MIMSQVNATVSHEIRNPTNSISCQNAAIKMLLERVDDIIKRLESTDAINNLNKIVEQFKRIHRKIGQALLINISSERLISFLIEDFLDLGLVRSGNFRSVDKTFALQQPIKEVIDILSFKAQHKSIKINTHYTGVDPEKKVRCDERRLMQVLLNLLSNALKFTPADGRIEISARIVRDRGSVDIYSEE